MKKTIPFIFLICVSSTLSGGDFRLLSFTDYYGKIEPDESYENLRNRYYVQPEFQASLFDYAMDLTVSANFWYQPIGDENFIDEENILREAYLSAPLGSFDISIGQKFETFGFADAYSPLNVINGADTTVYSLDDNVDGRRADAMVQLQFYPNFDDTLELIYIPFPRPNYEPRGSVNLQDSDRDITLNFDADPYFMEDAHSLFFRYYHLSSKYDLQVVYAWYVDRTPGFDFSDLDNSGSVLTGSADTVYTRNNLFGLGLSTALGNMVVVEDLAFTMTEDMDGSDIGIKNSNITANTQFTGTILDGTFAQLNVIYQYFFNYDEEDSMYTTSSYDDIIDEVNDYHVQPLEHIAFLIGHLHKNFLREKLYLGINVGFFFSTDVYMAPRITYAFSDRVHLETGADINTGKPSENDLVRSYDKDSFFIRLKYEY